MNTSNLENLEFLLRRIALGDKKAMRALYMSVGPDLDRFIQTRSRDPHEVADIVQETMLEVWRRAATFEGRSSVRTWIYSIACHKAADRWRKSTPTVAEADDTIADEAASPHAVLEALEDGTALRDCIAKLPAVQRAAVHLAFFCDLPYLDIAAIEGCSVGTVKTRVFHAKRLLLHCLSRRSTPSGA
ncbi:RNA polymerase sigma factor [Acuticoccus sp. MNP-M23]|uniref:RNA polymerase sigma factor n=1 Tax=Acuticoccus sp. MNP-M23 TaxID=3072793 RepID=UPI002816848F|nr:RNA polymerase sigma factor [Acuticoccus sp. MNP-M23]WMS41938.1 RNA polymerase sigma factor [Acuticoccus sp. MNP-M23]